MKRPWVHMSSPSRSPLPPPSPPAPSRSSRSTRSERLSHASNLGRWSVSPLIVYMFRKHHLYLVDQFIQVRKFYHSFIFFPFSYNKYPFNHEFIIIYSIKEFLFLSQTIPSLLTLFMGFISCVNFFFFLFLFFFFLICSEFCHTLKFLQSLSIWFCSVAKSCLTLGNPIDCRTPGVPVLHYLPAAAAAKSLRLCPTPCDPIGGSPPGSPVPGILQARTLEWVAISFSKVWKWKMKVKLLSRVRILATPWTAAYQAPPSMGFSRQEYWSGVPLPSPLSPRVCSNLYPLSQWCHPTISSSATLFSFCLQSFHLVTLPLIPGLSFLKSSLDHVTSLYKENRNLFLKLFAFPASWAIHLCQAHPITCLFLQQPSWFLSQIYMLFPHLILTCFWSFLPFF